MKSRSDSKKQKITYTKEEFKKRFVPSVNENLSIYEHSPQDVGTKLADEAIRQLKQTLVDLHKEGSSVSSPKFTTPNPK